MVARLVWEHRRCSHRTKAKAAENPSTVRISGGSENEKPRMYGVLLYLKKLRAKRVVFGMRELRV